MKGFLLLLLLLLLLPTTTYYSVRLYVETSHKINYSISNSYLIYLFGQLVDLDKHWRVVVRILHLLLLLLPFLPLFPLMVIVVAILIAGVVVVVVVVLLVQFGGLYEAIDDYSNGHSMEEDT